MATLTALTPVETGTTYTTASAAVGGDVVANNGKTILQVTNGSGSSITVTVAAVNTDLSNPLQGSVTKSNSITSVGAGATKIIGPFPTGVFNNTSGQIAITYSAVTSITIAAITL